MRTGNRFILVGISLARVLRSVLLPSRSPHFVGSHYSLSIPPPPPLTTPRRGGGMVMREWATWRSEQWGGRWVAKRGHGTEWDVKELSGGYEVGECRVNPRWAKDWQMMTRETEEINRVPVVFTHLVHSSSRFALCPSLIRPSFSPSIPLRETSERSEREEQERNETEWVSWVVSLWSFPSLPTPFRLVTLASRSERMRGRRNRVSEWGERGETRPLRSVHRFPTSYFGPDSLVSPPRLGSSHVMLGSLRSPHIPFVSPSRRRGGGNGRDRRWDGWDWKGWP